MTPSEEIDKLRGQLLETLAEDAHNAERLSARLSQLSRESGLSAHTALLLILTQLHFEAEEARQHWEAILAHRLTLTAVLGRDAGLRVALLDYFLHVNRRLLQPTLIDLTLLDGAARDADLDAATGLASDHRFRSALQSELRRARRYDLNVAVVLVDVDDFGRVNAAVGRLVGDRLFRDLAQLLRERVRDIDLAARPGEDELALLLPETDRNGALLVAERFRREAAACFERRDSGGQPTALTISAGVACFPEDASEADPLIQRAAQALYRAKAAGKNAVHVYQPERRRYLRFELTPGYFEVEVLAPADRRGGVLRDLSRNGILFSSPEPFTVGEEIEIRLAEGVPAVALALAAEPPLRLRGRVVRLEELPAQAEPADLRASIEDRFEIGVAFDLGWSDGTDDLLQFLERTQSMLGRLDRPS